MPNNQVSIIVPSCLKAWLDAYCGETGVKASELVRLLIVRESRLQRLKTMNDTPTVAATDPDAANVTAYFSSTEEAESFDAYARANAMTRRKAGLILLAAEQEERWLDRMLSQQ